MKNIFSKLGLGLRAGFVLILGLMALVATAATVIKSRPAPEYWVGQTRTNYFGINGAAVPVIISGTNTYTGITTNAALSGSFTLVIRNGLVVGTNNHPAPPLALLKP